MDGQVYDTISNLTEEATKALAETTLPVELNSPVLLAAAMFEVARQISLLREDLNATQERVSAELSDIATQLERLADR